MATKTQSGVGSVTPLSFFNRLARLTITSGKQFAHDPLTLVGTLIVALFIFLAIFGPAIAPYDFAERAGPPRQAPTWAYPFGTDNLGRDVFSRVIWGTREIMGLSGLGTGISVAIGLCVGLVIGYFGGLLDEIISRAFDSLLGIPALVLALVLLGTLGPSNFSIIAVIVIIYVPIITRVIRSATLNVRDSGYIEAAKLRGESILYILFREILPSVLPALAVEAALRFSYAIFLTASLGFLGLGVQPPSPDWGRMIGESRNFMRLLPWMMAFPAAAIALLVIGINLFADGLRKILRYEGQDV
ncbi:MAG: ABC transporter permease [Chloroflexi bacterium]|nr:MAG: ABC transporter permease [Chloroflexota bacterium]